MRKLIVLLAACAFVVAFTAPAMADWNFYGSSMVTWMGYEDSKETFGSFGGGGAANANFDDDDAMYMRHNDVVIGANVESGDIGGAFMLRPLESDARGRGIFADMYGTWNFGAGTLLVGQALGPINHFPSRSMYLNEDALVSFGGIFTWWKAMIMTTFSGDWGTLKLAVVEPEANVNEYVIFANNAWTPTRSTGPRTDAGNAAAFAFTDADTTLPKLEGSYSINVGPVNLTGMAGWQEYEVSRYPTARTERMYDVTSWVVGFGVLSSFGPVYVNGNIKSGQNLGQYMFSFEYGWDDAVYDTVQDRIIDNETWGFSAAAGINVNEMLSFEVGYGYLQHELEASPNNAGGNWEDDMAAYYINANINVAKGFSLMPEIGKVDYKDHTMGNGRTSVDEGDTVYYGVRWKIDF